jgi:4-amino-4-deoxy-L-arabinose transferase-like glycosyltransferase
VWWFFAAVFALGSLPWTLSAMRTLARDWRRRAPRGEFDPVVFLWVWVVFIGVFFSLSDSKLIPYVLPALPGLALLIAAAPAAAFRQDITWTAGFTVLAAAGLAAASLFGPRLLPLTERGRDFAALAGPLGEIAALLAASGGFVWLRRRDPTYAAVFLGVGWCLAGLLMVRAAGRLAPIYSGVVLARAAGNIPRDEPIYSVGTYDQTLPFYWQRTLELVSYRGELEFGLNHDPSAELPRIADFIGVWDGVPDAYAVMETPMFDDLRARGVPMREIARDLHRVLVARR